MRSACSALAKARPGHLGGSVTEGLYYEIVLCTTLLYRVYRTDRNGCCAVSRCRWTTRGQPLLLVRCRSRHTTCQRVDGTRAEHMTSSRNRDVVQSLCSGIAATPLIADAAASTARVALPMPSSLDVVAARGKIVVKCASCDERLDGSEGPRRR